MEIKRKLIDYDIVDRLKAYNKAMEFKRQGLEIKEIFKKLQAENLEVNLSTLYDWLKFGRHPKNRLNIIMNFDGNFSYLVGLIIGDGCFYKVMEKGSYNRGRICFGSKDKELAEKFSIIASIVLDKKKPYHYRWAETSKVYFSEFCSKQFVEFLLQPFEKVEKVIEPYISDFLKGIFDAEGSISIRYQNNRVYPRIFLTNANIKLINYIKTKLKEMDINSTIQLNTPEGKEKKIFNKKTKTNKDVYNLCIENIEGVRKFAEIINFSIEHKKRKLDQILNIIEESGNKMEPMIWAQLKVSL